MRGENLFKRKQPDPLAVRMRPQTLDEFVGQEHILSPQSILYRSIKAQKVKSMILYGPPGSGKTTLAHIIKNEIDAHFETLNAVIDRVEDLRQKIKEAKNRLLYENRKTILFIDEIYRFNKSQQEVLLPWLEDETVILIGTTTLNPFFYLSKALLSRVNIFELKPLTYDAIRQIVLRALSSEMGYKEYGLTLSDEALELILNASEGDARIALNILEQAAELTISDKKKEISADLIKEISKFKGMRYDVKGDEHYDVISAFIKSMRGTDPDAAVYWLARMLESGEDIRFIMRRMLIFASEDIGNADPFAAILASAIADSIERVGMPEARILLAQAATYLASAPKSNASYVAVEKAISDVRHKKLLEVPDHLRDFNFEGANKLERAKGMGKYKYPHDYPNAWVDQEYLPEKREYYQPNPRGFEKKIKERLDTIKRLKERRE